MLLLLTKHCNLAVVDDACEKEQVLNQTILLIALRHLWKSRKRKRNGNWEQKLGTETGN